MFIQWVLLTVLSEKTQLTAVWYGSSRILTVIWLTWFSSLCLHSVRSHIMKVWASVMIRMWWSYQQQLCKSEEFAAMNTFCSNQSRVQALKMLPGWCPLCVQAAHFQLKLPKNVHCKVFWVFSNVFNLDYEPRCRYRIRCMCYYDIWYDPLFYFTYWHKTN